VQHGVKEIYNCGTVTIIDDRLAIGYTAASQRGSQLDTGGVRHFKCVKQRLPR